MRVLLIPLGLMLLAVAAEAQIKPPTDVAAYDAVLAAVAPDQATVTLGDMIVPVETVRLWRDQLAGTAAPGSASQTGINKWTGGNVYYAFNANVSAAHQTAMLDAMAEWAMFGNLTFTARTIQTNYIMINDGGSGLFGGNSALGMVGGQQQLNIGSASWNRGTLVHELGHALGLIHEHQRSDRNTYVTIGAAVASDGNFTLIPTSTNNGAYDFLSVMHYARDGFAPLGVDDITPTAGYTQFIDIMGRSFERILSRADRDGIALMYAPAPVLTTVVTNTKDSGPGSLRAAIYKALDLATDTPGTTPTITFQIPNTDPNFSGGVFTIRPTARLPAPGSGTTIDATTQSAFTGNTNANGPEVVLNGALQINGDTYGLRLSQAGVTVRGMVINGFGTYGVRFTGSGATGNTVAGCYIGTNAAGTAPVANGFAGVEFGGGATGNTVGGTAAATRNVISGNTTQGVLIRDAGTSGNVVLGNYLGLNAAGTAGLGNGSSGVQIAGAATNNTVGGAVAGSGNVISGSPTSGISVSGLGTTGNVIAGNFIGTNAAGTAVIPNAFAGVTLSNAASGNNVGGTAPGAGNVLSGNTSQGILISGTGTNSNLVQGNWIGLNAAGTAALPNGFAGVQIGGGAQNNVIGGTNAAARNVISGNVYQGVFIGDAGTSGNRIAGNFIGTDPAGNVAIGNNQPGVEIYGPAAGNIIGGTEPGAGNVISANRHRQITIAFAGATGNVVAGNLVGLNAAGLAALPAAMNPGAGVVIFGGAQGNTIGGTSGGRNFISGNPAAGLSLSGLGTNANFIVGNSFGTTPTGTIVGNTAEGIALFADGSGGPQGNFIGGNSPGAANLISGNGAAGVALYNDGTTGNRISGNSITGNGGLGIDLWSNGVTGNDSGDGDTGPANLQNFPVLTSAVLGVSTQVGGTLNSAASTAFRIEFFANTSTAREGLNFVGAVNVTTDGSGNATITAVLPAIIPAGQHITATATDPSGNTSEFSSSVLVTTTDSEPDGLPDAYEIAHWLGIAVTTGNADSDGDGLTNAQEFRAGTDPRSGGSFLRLGPPTTVGADKLLSLPSLTGRTYRIDFADSLLAPLVWRTLADQIPGSGGALIFTDPSAAALPQRFYRATVVP